jgi:hypothetical protein
VFTKLRQDDGTILGSRATISPGTSVQLLGNLNSILNDPNPTLRNRFVHQATISLDREVGVSVGNNTTNKNWLIESGSVSYPTNSAGQSAIQINGSEYISIPLPSSYVVTLQTHVRFDYEGDGAADVERYVGLDWDGVYTNPEYLVSFKNQYSNGSGLKAIDVGIGQTYLFNTSAPANWIVVAIKAFTPGSTPSPYGRISNIRIYEADDAAGDQWTSTPLAIPSVGLTPITIDYQHNDNGTTATQDDTYRSQLWVGTSMIAQGALNKLFRPGDQAKIHILNQSPTEFGIQPTGGSIAKTFTREPGQIHAIGFDANQYSSEHIVDLQADLNALSQDGGSVPDIDDLLSYTAAKYWYEFNQNNKTIDGLLHAVGGQQWVGSGLISSDSFLLPSSVAHLDFPIVPHGMGVDLPNATHVSFDVQSGAIDNEAFQMVGYNASALENGILQEVVDSESISTMRGLQNAFANIKGKQASGNFISREAVQVFESIKQSDNTWKIFYRGEIGTGATTPYNPNSTTTRTEDQLMNLEDGGLVNHYKEKSNIANILQNVGINANGIIRVLVPRSRSVVGDWTGTVYVAEYDTNDGGIGSYIISPDNGTATHGGFIGDSIAPPKLTLPVGTSTNQTYHGDPVSVANGNMSRDELDFKFANPVVPLDFSRHYDSQNKLDIGFGAGWVHSFTGFIYQEADPANPGDFDYVWLNGKGERHIFEDNSGTNKYALPNTLYGRTITTSTGRHPTPNFNLSAGCKKLRSIQI